MSIPIVRNWCRRHHIHLDHPAREDLARLFAALEAENKELRSQRNAMKRRAECAEKDWQLAEAENKKLRAAIDREPGSGVSTCKGCGAVIDTRYCAHCRKLWESGKDMG